MQMFNLFDSNNDGILDFGEFVRSLSIFHPDTPQEQKAECMYLLIIFSITFSVFFFTLNRNVK